jgi:hypothetical protein
LPELVLYFTFKICNKGGVTFVHILIRIDDMFLLLVHRRIILTFVFEDREKFH